MKKCINEISKGTNLEMNLPVYANNMMNLYNDRASVEFAMDYYTFQEIISEIDNKDENLLGFVKRFNDIVGENICKIKVDESREEAIKEIDKLRNEIYKVVEILTAYADIFSRYEYVINRCEYLFKDFKEYEKHNDEEFTREIMQYIFSDEDNTAINAKICEIIAELPLRMTKNKFFEYLTGGMSVYTNTDKATIDDFIYVLKTSVMLDIPDGLETYQDLFEIYNELKNVDYKNIDEDKFNNLHDKLLYVADFIDEETSNYMMLQGLVNKCYAMIIAAPYAEISENSTKCAMDIIKSINMEFYKDDFNTLSEEITDKFIFLEGIPEKLQVKIQSYEYLLDTIRNDYMSTVKNIMLEKIYSGLFIMQNLLQDSLFIDLNENELEEEINVSEYLEQCKVKIIDEYREFFENNQKLVNKSVMALTLAKLPVFFNNITEIQDYVYNSLTSCTNKAEKLAAIEIIRDIMSC